MDGRLNDDIEVDAGATKDGMEGCDDAAADPPDMNEGMDMTLAEAGRGFSSSLSDPLSLLLLLKKDKTSFTTNALNAKVG